ncbi:MAG: CRISPR-associated protein Cas4 [Chlorobi bacterium]|nr:CRISPR-associated protein Cas4 [Chlorobiota bacterium]
MSITPSQIIEYLFCPRFTYFEYVLKIPQYEDRHYKVGKGRNIHDLKMVRNKDYLRKKIGAQKKYRDEYLTNSLIRGKVDEVLELEDSTMAPLDYKFAQYKERVYDTYKTQLHCYAVLIEDNFQMPVAKGFLVYVRSNDKLIEVPISREDKERVKDVAGKIIEIISTNYFPRATKFKKRCVSCTYRNICIK